MLKVHILDDIELAKKEKSTKGGGQFGLKVPPNLSKNKNKNKKCSLPPRKKNERNFAETVP
jgi:hypothetical protein